MTFIVGLLTVVLVLNCLVLILLVLIQLPKKETGAGLAFGGAATDALFGAGSGNVLTKITKYATGVFFVLAILLGVMQSKLAHRSETETERKLRELQSKQPATAPILPPAQETPPIRTEIATNRATTVPPLAEAPTNAPTATATNPASAASPPK